MTGVARTTSTSEVPISGSLAVRKRFPNSVLVEGEGGVSKASLIFGSDRIPRIVYDDLDGGQLPPRVPGEQSDVTCASP